MQIIEHWQRSIIPGLAIGVIIFGFDGSRSNVLGQSSVISSPGYSKKQNQLFVGEPTHTLPETIQATEKLLEQPMPPDLAGKVSMKQLRSRLFKLGLNLKLDLTTKDAIESTTQFEIPAPGKSIESNLRLLLRDFDCTLTIDRSGTIVLVDVEENENLMIEFTVDVTRLSNDMYELMDSIIETVEPDNWEFNGGVNRAYAYQANNRQFISFATAYNDSRKVRAFLAGVNRLQGKRVALAGTRPSKSHGVSTVIQLPGAKNLVDSRKRRRYGSSSGIGGMGGMGGGGLGGGVF